MTKKKDSNIQGKSKELKELKLEDLLKNGNDKEPTSDEIKNSKNELSKVGKSATKQTEYTNSLSDLLTRIGKDTQQISNVGKKIRQANKDLTDGFTHAFKEKEKNDKVFAELAENAKINNDTLTKAFSNSEFINFVKRTNNELEKLGKHYDQTLVEINKNFNFDSYYESLRSLRIKFKDEGSYVRTRIYLPNEKKPIIEFKTERNFKLGLLVYEILFNYITKHKKFKSHMTAIVKKEITSMINGISTTLTPNIELTEINDEGFKWFNKDKPDGEYQLCTWRNLMKVIRRQKRLISEKILIS